jgi:uncharacterized protein (DUF1499 family)
MNPYWLAPAIAIAVPLVLGPLGAWLRLLRPDTGFFLLGMAIFLALAASVALAAAAAYATVTARPWRRSALRAAILPVGLVVAAIAYLQSNDAPAIHDVSTDLVERPGFSGDPPPDPALAREVREELAFSAKKQREAYPDLAPLSLPEPPAAVYARALELAGRMPRWQVLRADAAALEIEASATSRIFGFVDDVAIRVRGESGGARIDVRSRSRLGQGDFGVNAARIRAFMRALQRPGS